MIGSQDRPQPGKICLTYQCRYFTTAMYCKEQS